MPQNAKQAWNEVGDRFASLGRHLSDHYKEAGSGQSAKEAQRTASASSPAQASPARHQPPKQTMA